VLGVGHRQNQCQEALFLPIQKSSSLKRLKDGHRVLGTVNVQMVQLSLLTGEPIASYTLKVPLDTDRGRDTQNPSFILPTPILKGAASKISLSSQMLTRID